MEVLIFIFTPHLEVANVLIVVEIRFKAEEKPEDGSVCWRSFAIAREFKMRMQLNHRRSTCGWNLLLRNELKVDHLK